MRDSLLESHFTGGRLKAYPKLPLRLPFYKHYAIVTAKANACDLKPFQILRVQLIRLN